MREEVLFEIRKKDLNNGLKKIPVGYCTTSYVDPKKGLHYAGRSMFEVSTWDPVDVLYLLFYGEDGTGEDIDLFFKKMQNHFFLSKKLQEKIFSLNRDHDPLDNLITSLLFLKMEEEKQDYYEDFFLLAGKMLSVSACLICHYLKRPFKNDYGKNWIESFLGNIGFSNEWSFKLFKLLSVYSFDQGGGAVDAFTGKVAASSKASLFSSVISSLFAYSGDLAGKASIKAYEKIREISSGNHTEIQLVKKLKEDLKKEERFYGYGFPGMKKEDTRATFIYQYLRTHFSHLETVQTAFLLRYEIPKILKEEKQINAFANMDAVSGVALAASGFEHSSLFPILFGGFRALGTAIQIYHERTFTRFEKPLPITHPHYIFRAITQRDLHEF